MKIKIRQIYKWQHHQIHKGNLQHRAKGRVSRRPISIILNPVPHTDQRRHTVDHKHRRTDPVRLAGKPHRMKQRIMYQNQCQTGHTDNSTAKVYEPFGPLKGCLVIASADFFSDQY